MQRTSTAALAVACATLLTCSEAVAPTFDELVERAEAVPEPNFDAARKQEPGYLDNYRHEQHARYRKRTSLLLEACRQFPNEARVPKLMDRRWTLLGWNQNPIDVAEEVLADIATTTTEQSPPLVQQHAAYWRSYFEAHQRHNDPAAQAKTVATFTDAYPSDARGVRLLELVATNVAAEPTTRLDTLRTLAARFPDTHAGKFAPGRIRQLESVGVSLPFSFTDFRSNSRVSADDLRGKVVVLDFWSTTCVPCVRELPHLRELYSRHRDRGVEFIGISLDVGADRGGDDALRAFLEREDIPWPQYYQGGGFDSAFSKSWGIGSIPAMFVLDRQGRLATVDGRGQLEDWIERLARD